jgi:hypothetical protein
VKSNQQWSLRHARLFPGRVLDLPLHLKFWTAHTTPIESVLNTRPLAHWGIRVQLPVVLWAGRLHAPCWRCSAGPHRHMRARRRRAAAAPPLLRLPGTSWLATGVFNTFVQLLASPSRSGCESSVPSSPWLFLLLAPTIWSKQRRKRCRLRVQSPCVRAESEEGPGPGKRPLPFWSCGRDDALPLHAGPAWCVSGHSGVPGGSVCGLTGPGLVPGGAVSWCGPGAAGAAGRSAHRPPAPLSPTHAGLACGTPSLPTPQRFSRAHTAT